MASSVALALTSRSARATKAGSPVVETASGKIRGAQVDGCASFKGIPYGAPTAGANRFMAPAKPTPWAGVRDAMQFGPMAQQRGYGGNKTAEMRKIRQGYLSPESHLQSEDCLLLNVWTPALDARKRPVMFWCHGGGFAFGMGDCDWCDGTNLARKHDVVVVSVNHRVGVFGYLSLGNAGNAGMLDLLAALNWVQENIAAFGGDAANVTAFGCSGGGNKVSTLLAMPAARGLFHKAIVQSGSLLRVTAREDAAASAQKLMSALELKDDAIGRLQALPPEHVLDAVAKIGGPGQFGPVVDGRSLLGHPFDPAAPGSGASVPMIIGTTRDEARFNGLADTRLFDLNETSLHAAVKDLGVPENRIDAAIKLYGMRMTGRTPSDIYFAIASDVWIRKEAVTQAERKAAQAGAPVYMYRFDRGIPNNRYRAGHTVEIPFVFDNVDSAPGIRGIPSDSRDFALARTMSDAWVAFARSGNPNHAGLPTWKPYETKARATLLFNYRSELVLGVEGSDGEGLGLLGPIG
jgi:para-nitrobenzyl esterase